MEEIQGAAELAVREMLKRIAKTTKGKPLEAVDYMDDGTPIQLKVDIDEKTGGAVFNFEGTGPEAYGTYSRMRSVGYDANTKIGNWNAPIAICNSSIIFALRCMVNSMYSLIISFPPLFFSRNILEILLVVYPYQVFDNRKEIIQTLSMSP